jgi:hypothetical protein
MFSTVLMMIFVYWVHPWAIQLNPPATLDANTHMNAVVERTTHIRQTQALLIGAEFLNDCPSSELLIQKAAAQMICNPEVATEILLAALHKLLIAYAMPPGAMYQLVLQAGLALDRSAELRLS